MLKITVGGTESYNDLTEEFVIVDGTELQLEHSLVSLSKWEEIFEKPFLGHEKKTGEEVLTYVKCMCLDDDIPPAVFQQLSEANFTAINDYLNAKKTATWFSDQPGAPKSSEVVTAELIYYWLTVFNIPWDAQYWHLNKLFTLIRICNVKQAKPKKMSRAEEAQRRRELNEQRKRQLGTTG
jgi:hypothetical protein